MLPPRNAPNVTAGFTWPPEMLAPTETATNNASACDKAAAMRPAGVVEPAFVSLSDHNINEVTLMLHLLI